MEDKYKVSKAYHSGLEYSTRKTRAQERIKAEQERKSDTTFRSIFDSYMNGDYHTGNTKWS